MSKNSEWPDILEIGPQCDERFVECDNTPELKRLACSISGASNLVGNYTVARSNPEWHALIYVVGGELDLTTRSGQKNINSCHLVTLPAGQPFIMDLKAQRLDIVWFHIEQGRKWDKLIEGRPDVEFCEVTQQIYHSLSLLYYEPQPLLRKPVFSQLENYITNSLSPIATRSHESQRIWQLQQALEKRLHYNWTVESMADIANYSAPHLHRLFQNEFSRSPVQHLIHLRMERAKYLLTHTDWTLEQIGEQVGYGDVFNFSKRFKKSTGIAPGQYRKTHLEVKVN
ncbi:helix-turn-helix transcriptional regulator [Paraglaciecola aquimarina]|uniref:Helix-turn-helix transcriptional regulator n=1 Tax=Paraglaciecola aquimarina TaxID=1235557 RepID=A0ABU3SX36_9ALTE|nr:helix-turn-helix transcriptional regulator [Paraglaciecola aquimarina]MDU0354585.1 helix-turn-helix transcriptional regulator [Paraglaciecola aquimarina]